jgi:hypothetical protein
MNGETLFLVKSHILGNNGLIFNFIFGVLWASEQTQISQIGKNDEKMVFLSSFGGGCSYLM